MTLGQARRLTAIVASAVSAGLTCVTDGASSQRNRLGAQAPDPAGAGNELACVMSESFNKHEYFRTWQVGRIL